MNHTQKVVLPTMPAPRRYQVQLDNGQVWTGTKRELLESHPSWLPFAVEIQQPTAALEQDYADDPYPSRLPSSSRRYTELSGSGQGETSYHFHPNQRQPGIPPRTSAKIAQETEDRPAARRRRSPRLHWLVYAGIGGIVALILWVGASWVSNWWTNTQNDWTYTAQFRTFSVDKAVGHNGDSNAHPSHFIVQNDKRKILIIEFPADDTSKAIIYAAPTLIGDGQEKTPVTLSFQLNLQTNRLDMVLHVQDQTYIFPNKEEKFVETTE